MILVSDYAYKPILRVAKGDVRREVFNLTPLLNKTNDTLNNVSVKGEGLTAVVQDYDFFTVTLDIQGKSESVGYATVTCITGNDQTVQIPITVYVVGDFQTGDKPYRIPEESLIYEGIDNINAFHEAVESLGS